MRGETFKEYQQIQPAETVIAPPGESLLDINEPSSEVTPPMPETPVSVPGQAKTIIAPEVIATTPVAPTETDVMNLTDPTEIEAGISRIFEAGSDS